ncbi:MAG: hypothetical protein ACI4PF_02560 [Christensenellales bacterium]
MYNYKFGDDVTDAVVLAYNDSVKTTNIDKIKREIDKINKQLFLDNDIYNQFVIDNCQTRKIDKQENNNFESNKKIILNNYDAFNKEDIKSFEDIGNKYSNLLKSIEFELKILIGYKNKFLSEFNMVDTIKINKKISTLNNEISRIKLEIDNCNKDIAIKEKEYNEKFILFLKELKSTKNINQDDFVSKFGENIVNNYKIHQIENMLDKYFIDKNEEDIKLIFSSEEIKSVLGKNFDYILQRYNVGNVGADC